MVLYSCLESIDACKCLQMPVEAYLRKYKMLPVAQWDMEFLQIGFDIVPLPVGGTLTFLQLGCVWGDMYWTCG